MRGSLAEGSFSGTCKPLIERRFLGVFRFAQMALAGSGGGGRSNGIIVGTYLAKIANIVTIDDAH
jgi:hypothetical protein